MGLTILLPGKNLLCIYDLSAEPQVDVDSDLDEEDGQSGIDASISHKFLALWFHQEYFD